MTYFKPKKYVKDESYNPIYRPLNYNFTFTSRLLPGLAFFSGIFVLTSQVIIPLVVFKNSDNISKPVAQSVLGQVSGFSEFSFEELSETPVTPAVLGTSSNSQNSADLSSSHNENNEINEEFFYLSIPKLKIVDAKVQINSPSLSPDEFVGHYPGSTLPGQEGNAFIYGHSVLPFFYNPKNYKTIFSTIHTLEVGDEFFITYLGKKQKYLVESKSILKPEKVNPLGKIKPDYLKQATAVLMTCYPPGTKTYRLMVNAVKVD